MGLLAVQHLDSPENNPDMPWEFTEANMKKVLLFVSFIHFPVIYVLDWNSGWFWSSCGRICSVLFSDVQKWLLGYHFIQDY